MQYSNDQLWQRYREFICWTPEIGIAVDISRMNLDTRHMQEMAPKLHNAFKAMDELEKGAIANKDEHRMVGHYWLRDAGRAPTAEISKEIQDTNARIVSFAADVHAGRVKAQGGKSFKRVLVIGIGGSALGPEFVADALGSQRDKLVPSFFDNTDPDGMDRVLEHIGAELGQTLTVVISKSGGTKETRNGMLVAKAAYEAQKLNFAQHAVAVTGAESELDKTATNGQWLARFPMWDWVGGRTSELSAVGLLPAALQGIDINAMLAGARDTDGVTRRHDIASNPAALLALAWYKAGDGKGRKDMVVLPYKDRLVLFSRYLQQLVMESLGKESNRQHQRVEQGIAVYGNKGSTDQHAYVQQLRDGVNNFFITFIEVLKDRSAEDDTGFATNLMMEPEVTSGDYLSGFYQGTRRALGENGRESLTITLDDVTPRSVGSLIALFERAVGFYAEMVDINAYHQPGVEAGKRAAGSVIALQLKVIEHMRQGKQGRAEEIAAAVGAAEDTETVLHILRHLAANGRYGIAVVQQKSLVDSVYGVR